jgi:hypothetical protein
MQALLFNREETEVEMDYFRKLEGGSTGKAGDRCNRHYLRTSRCLQIMQAMIEKAVK